MTGKEWLRRWRVLIEGWESHAEEYQMAKEAIERLTIKTRKVK